MRGLSPVAASRGHSSSRCAGLSLSQPLLLRSTGSRRAGSVIVAHGPSRSAACGILPDQGSNPCPLHWQADSQPLRHQGSPILCILIVMWFTWIVTIYEITRRVIKLTSHVSWSKAECCGLESPWKHRESAPASKSGVARAPPGICSKQSCWLWRGLKQLCKRRPLSLYIYIYKVKERFSLLLVHNFS